MSALENVLARLERVRKAGSGWYARCPAHEDRSPSLRIALGEDERVLLDCKVGCLTSDVIAAIGLEWRDLFEDSSSPRQPHAPKRVRRNTDDRSPLTRQEIEEDWDKGLLSHDEYMRLLGLWNLGQPDLPRSRVEIEFDEHGEVTHYELRPKPLGRMR